MAPPLEYQDYHSPYIGKIADLLQEPGRAQARAAEIGGQARGQALTQMGQGLGSAITHVTDPRVQMEQQQVDANKRAMALNAQVNQIINSAMVQQANGTKTIDRDKLRQIFTAANIPLPLQKQTFESLDEVDASVQKFATTRTDHLADVAHATLQNPHGATPDTFAFAAAVAKANGLVTDDQLAPVFHAVANGADVTDVLSQVRGLSEKYKDVNKPTFAPRQSPGYMAGGTFHPMTVEQPPTNASLAADATNPNSPTAGQSRQALGLLTSRADAQAAESARHHTEMEKIARMDAGRAQAAQVEIARHNRAMEAANDPFGAFSGSPGGGGGAATPGQPPATGTTRPVAGASAPPPGAPAGAPRGAAPTTGPTGDDYLRTLPANVAGEVKAYAEGRRPFPAGFALKSPYFQRLIQMVGQYDPTFDATNYSGRVKARQDFTAGGSAKQITALNTVVGHLDDLSGKADALANTDAPAYNSLKNWVKTQFGSSATTNFNTVKKGVQDELTRVWRQAGGSEQDIKTWGESLNAAQSPEQLKGAFATIAGMLESRLDALENQKQQGLGKFGNDIQVVTPQSRTRLNRLQGNPSAGSAGSVTVTSPSGKTYTFRSQADADTAVAQAKAKGLWK